MKIYIHKKGTWFNTIFWLLYVVMIALPLHASNNFLSYFSITGSITIFQVVIVVMWIYSVLCRARRKTTFSGVCLLAFFVAWTIALLRGFLDSSHVFNNVIGDSSMYLFSIALLGIASSGMVRIKSLEDFFYTTFCAMTVNLAINALMSLTSNFSFWGLTAFNGGRIAGGYLSLLVATILYGFYDYLYDRRIKTWLLVLHVILAVYVSVLSQSRTHIILCFVGSVIVLLFSKKRTGIALLRSTILLVILFAGILFFLNSGNALAERLLNMDISSDTETTASRIITWTYYWNLIKQTPLGTGFGEIVYFINPSMTIARSTATYYIDNGVALVLYKGGWLFGILYLSYLVCTIIVLLKQYFSLKKDFYILVTMIFIMLIFSLMIMTSQIIHTYAPNVFMWTLVGMIMSSYEKDEVIVNDL